MKVFFKLLLPNLIYIIVLRLEKKGEKEEDWRKRRTASDRRRKEDRREEERKAGRQGSGREGGKSPRNLNSGVGVRDAQA